MLRLWGGSCNEVIGMDRERSRERVKVRDRERRQLFVENQVGRNESNAGIYRRTVYQMPLDCVLITRYTCDCRLRGDQGPRVISDFFFWILI